MESDDIDKAYNMAGYDEEGGGTDSASARFNFLFHSSGIFGIMDTNYYPSNKLDPNITVQEVSLLLC